MKHILWKTGDEGVPSNILDRNNEVVLASCKLCGLGESQLNVSSRFSPAPYRHDLGALRVQAAIHPQGLCNLSDLRPTRHGLGCDLRQPF
jgi:hypothetical protein